MSLAKALEKQKKLRAPATKNRVLLLLDDLHNSEDLATLRGALQDSSISNAVLTRTLKAVYGDAIVNNTSVREYRVNLMSTVDGL